MPAPRPPPTCPPRPLQLPASPLLRTSCGRVGLVPTAGVGGAGDLRRASSPYTRYRPLLQYSSSSCVQPAGRGASPTTAVGAGAVLFYTRPCPGASLRPLQSVVKTLVESGLAPLGLGRIGRGAGRGGASPTTSTFLCLLTRLLHTSYCRRICLRAPFSRRAPRPPPQSLAKRTRLPAIALEARHAKPTTAYQRERQTAILSTSQARRPPARLHNPHTKHNTHSTRAWRC